MAQKFYNVRQAAEVLGTTDEEVRNMLQRRELHGYRDGADWKFKTEEVDKLAAERGGPAPSDDQEDLLSEVELGESDPGASGTVIGGKKKGEEGSAESDLKRAEAASEPSGQEDAQLEELDLTLDEDLTLEDSTVAAGAETKKEQGGTGDSALDISGEGGEDEELVLGGSGTGSDITIGGDSGISLVDPADSGLSLDEPPEGGGDEESLELGEEDMLSLAEASDIGAGMKPDDDFLLTPADEGADADDSESGSQVIALDTEGEGDEAATVIAGGGGGMAAMLDEDFSGQPGAAAGAPLGAPGAGAPQAAGALGDMGYALPEAPYTVWNIVSLALVTIVLVFCGMFMYDLLRNMWSWDTPYEVNSSIMDTILGWFEG